MAVRVVVSVFGVTVFVAHGDHRNTLREKQRAEKVAHLSFA